MKKIPVLLKNDSQVVMGLRVELEHKDTIIKLIKSIKPDIDDKELNKLVNRTIRDIVGDHNEEDKLYYTKLLKAGL